jgi:Domain of unknown function (DUF4224)
MFNVLPREEVYAITGKRQPAAQRRALEDMRIPFVQRPDGYPAVAREAANQAMGVQSAASASTKIVIDTDAI